MRGEETASLSPLTRRFAAPSPFRRGIRTANSFCFSWTALVIDSPYNKRSILTSQVSHRPMRRTKLKRALFLAAVGSLAIFACSVGGRVRPPVLEVQLPRGAGMRRSILRAIGLDRSLKTGVIAWRPRQRAMSAAYPSAQKAEESQRPGIRKKTPRPKTPAKPTASAASCTCRDACTSRGMRTTPKRSKAEAGAQTRLLAFAMPRTQGNDWQGVSVATWDRPAAALSGFSIGRGGASRAPHSKS